ncbi:MAG: WD40 repeat domain-containing protein [Anaerolineae bacterium]|nr:MAG: WD40 repeat domain-containing protein [Anaerolineae bacterium]
MNLLAKNAAVSMLYPYVNPFLLPHSRNAYMEEVSMKLLFRLPLVLGILCLIIPSSGVSIAQTPIRITVDNATEVTEIRMAQTPENYTGALVSFVVFSPEGDTLAAASFNAALIYLMPDLEYIDFYAKEASWLVTLAYSPDGQFLVTPEGPFSMDYHVIIWDLATGNEVATLLGHQGAGTAAAFSPDGQFLATGDELGFIKLWDMESLSEVNTVEAHGSQVSSLAFSPDGAFLVSASWDQTIKVWNVETMTEVTTLTGHTDRVYTVAFSPDGSLLASASKDNTIRLWDMESLSEVATLEGHIHDEMHPGGVFCVAFSPDGTLLASGGDDYVIKLWDVEARTELTTLSGHLSTVTSVGFSPDGSYIASGSYDFTVRLWGIVE